MSEVGAKKGQGSLRNDGEESQNKEMYEEWKSGKCNQLITSSTVGVITYKKAQAIAILNKIQGTERQLRQLPVIHTYHYLPWHKIKQIFFPIHHKIYTIQH